MCRRKPEKQPEVREAPEAPEARADEGSVLRRTVIHQCCEMLAYALEMGETIPPRIVAGLERAGVDFSKSQGCTASITTDDPASMTLLVTCHNALADIVAPATPRGISELPWLLDDRRRAARRSKKSPEKREMSRVDVLRWAAGITLVTLLVGSAAYGFLAQANLEVFRVLSGATTPDVMLGVDGGLGSAGLGFYLLLIGLSALLGSLLRELSLALGHVERTRYDRKFEKASGVRMVVGVASGVVLSLLLGQVTSGAKVINVPPMAWALAGGYSSDAVLRLLASFVESLRVFISKGREAEAADLARARNQGAANATDTANVGFAVQLAGAKAQIREGQTPDDFKKTLDALLLAALPDMPEWSASEEGGAT